VQARGDNPRSDLQKWRMLEALQAPASSHFNYRRM
jgi:hypothetical protein